MSIEDERKTLTWVDWLVICLYFVCCIGAGLWAKFFKRKGPETAETYFLAGRSMLWWAVGGSLFASNIGSEHFIGLAGSGAATGIAVASYEWQASWILLLLGWLFVPIYLRSRIFTMPEYLQRRFQSKWIRAYLTLLALFNYIFTKVSVDIYAGGLFLYEAIGWNIYISSAVILVITALYTMLGGLAAVIYTDTVQCTVMIIGAIVLSAIGFNEIGGMTKMWEKYPLAIGQSVLLQTGNMTLNSANMTDSASCYGLVNKWDHMFRPVDDAHYPWVGLWFSLPIIGIWYWCTDQVIVQRALGAKNNIHAKSGTIFAGFIKTLPLFIMVMPGMISRILYANDVGCPDPESCLKACNNENGCTNLAYPKLVVNLLPEGVVGLMLAVMIAALMSSLSSAFNSSSTIFTVDIWQRLRPSASNREMLIVGRIVVSILVVIGIIWIPIIAASQGGQLFVYIQTVITYLTPPITATFLLGILWPRATEKGVGLGMVIGLILGLVRFIMDNIYKAPSCGQEDTRPGFVKMHFMYFGIVLFVVSGFVMILVSFFTEPVPLEDLGGLTWSTLQENPVRRKLSLIRETPDDFDPAEGAVQLKDVVIEGQSVTGKPPKEVEVIDPDERMVVEGHPLEEETPAVKWTLRILTLILLVYLVILWVYYR